MPGSRVPGFPGSRVPGSRVPGFPGSRVPGSRVPGLPGSRVPGFPSSRVPGFPVPGFPGSRVPGFPPPPKPKLFESEEFGVELFFIFFSKSLGWGDFHTRIWDWADFYQEGPSCTAKATSEGMFLGRPICRQRPYRVECTGSLPNSEVKRRRARLVLGWGTAREDLRVPLAFFNRGIFGTRQCQTQRAACFQCVPCVV